MINNVRRQIFTVGDDGPTSYKMPAVAWETKEKVANIQHVCGFETRTKYFPNTCLQRNASIMPVPQMGQILKGHVLAIFK